MDASTVQVCDAGLDTLKASALQELSSDELAVVVGGWQTGNNSE